MSQQQLTIAGRSVSTVSSWSFCRLSNYWPYHSIFYTSTRILVWFHRHKSYPGFSLTFHLVPLLLISMASNLLPLNLSTMNVPQGSVHGPLLFILYTTPLSSIISQSSVNHKLYMLIWRHSTFSIIFSWYLLAFHKIFYSCRIYYIQHFFMDAWPQTFYLSTLLKLNFFSLDFQHNFLKFKSQSHAHLLQLLQIQQLIYNLFLLLEILVLSLILIFLFWYIHFEILLLSYS